MESRSLLSYGNWIYPVQWWSNHMESTQLLLTEYILCMVIIWLVNGESTQHCNWIYPKQWWSNHRESTQLLLTEYILCDGDLTTYMSEWGVYSAVKLNISKTVGWWGLYGIGAVLGTEWYWDSELQLNGTEVVGLWLNRTEIVGLHWMEPRQRVCGWMVPRQWFWLLNWGCVWSNLIWYWVGSNRPVILIEVFFYHCVGSEVFWIDSKGLGLPGNLVRCDMVMWPSLWGSGGV